jgi:hypothetical protein
LFDKGKNSFFKIALLVFLLLVLIAKFM